MRHQLKLFLVAVQFLTRIPVPAFARFEDQWLQQSCRYFPAVGLCIGLAIAAVFFTAAAVLPTVVAVVLALGFGIALTGAFHEDGLADTADGLGGGLTPQRRLEIMKDSRIGTYGAVTLVVVLALKASALAALPIATAAAVIMAAHAGARWLTVIAIAVMPYAGDRDQAKAKPLSTSAHGSDVAIASVFGLVPIVVLLPVWAGVVCLLGGMAAAGVVAWQAHRLIGGYTGDVLGAMEQLFEAGVMVAAAGCLASVAVGRLG